MNKIKNRKLMGVLLVVMAFMLTLGVFFVSPMTASAATSSSPKYTTYGSYNIGDGNVNGYLSEYKIYMHSSSTTGSTGTISNGKVLNWTYVYIKIDATDVDEHTSFKLTRNGSTYVSKTLSGDGDITLYSGALPDGQYVLTYVGKHWDGIFSKKTYTYTYNFVIDKSAPTYSLKAGSSTISSGSYTNQQITYSVSDYKTWCIYYKRPGNSSYSTSYNDTYTVAANASNNGWWYFYAEDYYYNTNSSVMVYLDVTKPTGKVTNASGTTISNGGYANSAIKYTASDAHSGVSYCQVKKPGSSSWSSYTSGTALSGTHGWYTFRCYDRSNNVSDEYKVFYDNTAPTGTLYGGTSVKSSGAYTNASYIKYVASDGNSGIANCYVKMPNSSYYTAYASGTQVATEGQYAFYCVDNSNNRSSTVYITLDKTKPTGTLYGGTSVITSGGATNASYIKFVPYDAIGLSATYVKKPGATSYVAYTSGTQFTAEGEYLFYCVDLSQNQSQTYKITLDRQIPAAQILVDGVTVNNNSYTNGDHISFVCDENCFVKLPGTNTFVEYLSGTEYYKEGKYVFYGLSQSNTSSGYYTVTIDRSIKTANVSNVIDGKTNGDVTITWTNGDAELYAPIKSVTVNGKSISNGEIIHTIDTAKYKVVVVDMANNIWETEFVSSKQNVLTETLQKEYYEIFDANGDYFSFSTYESAFNFAVARENGYVRKGTWNNATWDTGIAMDSKDSVNAVNGEYFIYKKSGSPNEEVAYFTLERLNEVIAEYAEIGIESYFYFEKEPATIAEGENLFGYSDTKNILADKIILGDNIGVLLNGEEFVGNEITIEGKHILVISDDFDNVCEYTITVVRNAPDIFYAIGEGENNLVTFDRTYYLKNEITVSIADEFDEFAMFSVFDEDGKLIGHYSLGDTVTLTESGTYTVEAVNHFGKSETFKVIISRNAPTVTIKENEMGKKLEVTITASEDKESHIQTLEIYKSTDNGETWVLVEKDDYGATVALGTNSYAFRTSGKYKVVITDEFRTGIDAITAELEYVQDNPVGTLKGVENGGYTNANVSFEWADEAVVTLEKDGETVSYVSGQSLTENGNYTLTIENFDGYKTTYTFVIDKDKPEVTLEGVDANSSVSGDVIVKFTEKSLTAELFKDGVSVGEYVSGTAITDSADYKVVVTDLANNSTEVTFRIDKVVDYEININDKGLANSVTVTANEEVTVVLAKGEETLEYKLGDAVTVPGTYTVTLTDKLNNSTTVEFTIVEPLVKSFEHNFDNTPGFEKVMMNGEEKRLNYGTLELLTDGVHEVSVIANGETYTFTVTVDGTAPALKISGAENGGTTKDTVVLSDLTEKAEMRVYLNDQEISYKLGEELTELGKYRVVLTDECGNKTEYNFEILYSMNGGAIALIVIGVLAVIGVVIAIIFGKKAAYKTNKKNGNNGFYN